MGKPGKKKSLCMLLQMCMVHTHIHMLDSGEYGDQRNCFEGEIVVLGLHLGKRLNYWFRRHKHICLRNLSFKILPYLNFRKKIY